MNHQNIHNSVNVSIIFLFSSESQGLSLFWYIILLLKYKDCFRYHITREYNFVPSIWNLKPIYEEFSHIYIYIHTYIYVYTQQYPTIVSTQSLLFSAWQHVSAAHATIFRLALSWPEDGCMNS